MSTNVGRKLLYKQDGKTAGRLELCSAECKVKIEPKAMSAQTNGQMISINGKKKTIIVPRTNTKNNTIVINGFREASRSKTIKTLPKDDFTFHMIFSITISPYKMI